MRISILYYFVFFVLVFSHLQTHSLATKHSYIVYMGAPQDDSKSLIGHIEAVLKSHLDFLTSLFPSVEQIENQLIYSYSKIFDGFAVMLNEEQAKLIAKHSRVISVFKNNRRKFDTTHSWDFLGLNAANSTQKAGGVNAPIANWVSTLLGQQSGNVASESIWEKAKYGEDVIIGSLDSGVWPESPSFNDDGYGPVPLKWGGVCQKDSNVTCNRKLIGARYFSKGYESEVGSINPSIHNARDNEGHGTHTLSTAAGSFVHNINVFGIVNGTAEGGAPKARVAVYKVCWPSQNDSGGCFDADVLAAFDAAITDGVDIISMSLGGSGIEMYMDATGVGSFQAVYKGILVVTSAGNDGPTSGTVKNVAPWVITVGASTTDREFSTYIILGNNNTIKGTSLSDKALQSGKFYPLIRGADARTDSASPMDGDLCKPGALDAKKVTGKILVCLRGQSTRVAKGYQATLAGAVGMILVNDELNGNQTLSEPHILPASHISFTNGQAVYSYINSTKTATANICPVKIEFGTEPAPMMAAFSSRGPNPFEEAILKPDITSPGVNIIAAYPDSFPPSELESDTRRVNFNILSGTSMSCPHVAGIAALIKAVHPDWSPAAIKSALMTTASTQGNNKMPILESTGIPATPFAYGAGHIQPSLAIDPGLVYDLSSQEYLDFFCARVSYPFLLRALSTKVPSSPCSSTFSVANFNYPSITVPNVNVATIIVRKVKNVGTPGTYTVRVEAPPGMRVIVDPTSLTFQRVGEVKNYTVTFKPVVKGFPRNFMFGRLVWSDGKHNVSSPLIVKHA